MIWTACTFFNEFELLNIQREETKDLEIKHIIVDGNWTFSGKEKSFAITIGPELSNVIHLHEYLEEPDSNPWNNEKRQRNAILEVLIDSGMKDDDIVIIRDADEVVSCQAIKTFRPEMELAFLEMKKYNYFLNVYEGPWNRAKAMTGAYLRSRTPEEVRNSGAPHSIPLAGWHWSFLGGVDAVLEKFASFSHQEPEVQKHAVRENIEHKLRTAESLWAKDLWKVVEIDSSFPQYVQDHQFDTLKHLIFHGNS